MKLTIKSKRDSEIRPNALPHLLKDTIEFNRMLKDRYDIDSEVTFKFEK